MDKIEDSLRLFFYAMRKLLELCVQVGIVGGVFWGAYTVAPEILDRIPKILDLLLTIEPEIFLGILAAGATILGSTVTPAWLNHLQYQRQLEAEHRKQLIPIYEEWLKTVIEFATPGKKSNYKALEKTSPELVRQIMLRGNDDVVNTFYAYLETARQQISEEEEQSSEKGERIRIEKARKMLYSLEDFFFSMRRTLGHKNKHIERETLLKFLVRDMPTPLETREDTKALSEKKTRE